MRWMLALVTLGVVLNSTSSWAASSSNPSCSSFFAPGFKSTSVGLRQLLDTVPPDTKWIDLSPNLKAQLRAYADSRLAEFRSQWSESALSTKEAILVDCPTDEMKLAIDDFYSKSYSDILPVKFSLKDIKNRSLSRLLVRGYLGAIAAYRATLTYPSARLPNRDWDGKSPFDSVRLPDEQAYTSIKNYNARLVLELRAIDDASLDDKEKTLKEQVLFDVRARAVGSFSGDSFGGEDMKSACEIVSLNNDVIQGYHSEGARPRMFATDDDVLAEVNAIYLHNTTLKWLDIGTFAASGSPLCQGYDDDLMQYVGNPQTNSVARGIVRLRDWWIERVAASADAQKKCSVYSAADRHQAWEAFSADQRSNNNGTSSMETYRDQLQIYRANMLAKYRSIARQAVKLLFPDDAVLTSRQRASVESMIDAETAFGLFPQRVAAALDHAQGTTDGPAATIWRDAFTANVASVGGDYLNGAPVRAEDAATVMAMFDEVKAWVAKTHRGLPVDIESLYSKFHFSLSTDGGATTSTSTGDIVFGVGTKRSKMEYYSILIHELRHAVNYAWRATSLDKSKVTSDSGNVIEGSGVAVENLLLEPFMRDALGSDLVYALYALDYGIRDARFVGTTDATLQKYFRSGCDGPGDPNTIDFAKTIAESYGLTGNLANTVALRSHIGTQYFQYISGGVQVSDDISYLQAKIDPTRQHRVDPFVLFACGLNNPRRDEYYVNALRACMKL